MIADLDNICTMVAKYIYKKCFKCLPSLFEKLSDWVQYKFREQKLYQWNKLEVGDKDILDFFDSDSDDSDDEQLYDGNAGVLENNVIV